MVFVEHDRYIIMMETLTCLQWKQQKRKVQNPVIILVSYCEFVVSKQSFKIQIKINWMVEVNCFLAILNLIYLVALLKRKMLLPKRKILRGNVDGGMSFNQQDSINEVCCNIDAIKLLFAYISFGLIYLYILTLNMDSRYENPGCVQFGQCGDKHHL